MRVFLIEDRQADLDLLRAFVTRRCPAAEIHCAVLGADGLALMRAHGKPGDVAIIDYLLPDTTGDKIADMAPEGIRCHVVSASPPSGQAGREIVNKIKIPSLIGEWLCGRCGSAHAATLVQEAEAAVVNSAVTAAVAIAAAVASAAVVSAELAAEKLRRIELEAEVARLRGGAEITRHDRAG